MARTSLWMFKRTVIVFCVVYVVEATIQLKTTQEECNDEITEKKKYLICNLNNTNEAAEFRDDNWGKLNYTQVQVHHAKGLAIKSQRGTENMTWNFTYCEGVFVADKSSSLIGELRLIHSKVITISNVDKVLHGTDSFIEKVDIKQAVEQFDFISTGVGDLSISAFHAKTTIVNSTIGLIRKLEVRGTFLFEIKNNTRINRIKKMVLGANGNSQITDSIIKEVDSEGVEVWGPFLMNNVIFEELASRAIVVKEGTLTVSNCAILEFPVDSIVVENGSIVFDNVLTRGQNQSFSIQNVKGGYYPFAALYPYPSCSAAWALVGVGIPLSLLMGFIFGCAVAFYVFQRRNQSLNPDTSKLLPEVKVEASPLPVMHPAPPTPNIPHELPQEGKKKEEEEDDYEEDIYDEYQDIDSQVAPPANSTNLQSERNNFRDFPNNLPVPSDPPRAPLTGLPSLPTKPIVPPSKDRVQGGPFPKANPPLFPPLGHGGSPAIPPPGKGGPPASKNLPPLKPQGPMVPLNKKPEPINHAQPALSKPPEDIEMDFYDEVNEPSPSSPPPSASRPPVASAKPSFLHTKPKPLLPVAGKPQGGPANSRAPPALPPGKPRLQKWPPNSPSKPAPPPSELKPGSASLEVDEDDVYEIVPE